ncbi:MAG: carbohydrate kinase family protein [Pseudomonadota bacterium]
MQRENVLVLGAASWNRMVYVLALPQGASATIFDAREVENVGSTGVGKSMALAAFGCKPVLHCTLGNDDLAWLVQTTCQTRQIDLIVNAQDAPTPHHLNIMDEKGGRYSLFISNGPANPKIDEARIVKAIQSAPTIFLSLCASSKKLLPIVQQAEAEVLLDLHDYDGQNPWYDDFISCADVIQLSDVALSDPTRVIKRLLAGRAQQVVLTKADKGAQIITDQSIIDVPPCPAKLRDSNGAGDAFSVALWHAQRAGLELSQAGDFAAAAAAFAVESEALFPRDLSLQEIAKRASITSALDERN